MYEKEFYFGDPSLRNEVNLGELERAIVTKDGVLVTCVETHSAFRYDEGYYRWQFFETPKTVYLSLKRKQLIPFSIHHHSIRVLNK